MVEQLHVVTVAKTLAATAHRHVGVVWPLLICEPVITHASFVPAPPAPQGHV